MRQFQRQLHEMEKEEEDAEEEGGSFFLRDDMVLIRQGDKTGDPRVITVNCPDKTGLGCDLCRIILFFGVTIVRGDLSTDGKWCLVVLWVVGKEETRWGLLKSRLLGVCPPAPPSIYSCYFRQVLDIPRRHQRPQVFVLKFWCFDRLGLLHDVTQVLCELELTIRRVKVLTTPDGRVVDIFFITDTRELLHTKKRREDTYDRLYSVLGGSIIKCEIEQANTELASCLQASCLLPPTANEEMFNIDISRDNESRQSETSSTVTVDNSLSPSHTLIQISCRDHKGLMYDIMRILKDHNIQLSYGRFYTSQCERCDIDLFVMQSDGKKIVDLNKQKAISSSLRMELQQPLRVTVVKRGPDMELLVANSVEISGNGRPLVFHDITLALKTLRTRIFLAEIGRHMVGGREWEVYRILLHDACDYIDASVDKIENVVMSMLMGWEQS